MQSDQRFACAQGSTFAHPIARINIARCQLSAVALLFADPRLSGRAVSGRRASSANSPQRKNLLSRFQVFKQRIGIRHRKGVFFKVVSEARLFEQFFNNAIANQH